MPKNAKTPRSKIIATIALVLKTIAKEDALRRVRRELGIARRELGMLNEWKKHKADTTKSLQMIIGWCTRAKTLKEGDSRKNSGRCAVDEVNRGHDSFTPEMMRYRGRKQKRASSLQNVTMLPLGNPILSRRVRTRLLRKGIVGGEQSTKSSGEVLTCTIRTKKP